MVKANFGRRTIFRIVYKVSQSDLSTKGWFAFLSKEINFTEQTRKNVPILLLGRTASYAR